jgi:hypothetical protein
VLLVCTVYSALYGEIALSRKQCGIGHMYIYIFLLRMADTMTSQNIDLSPWDTPCVYIGGQGFTRVSASRVIIQL